MKVIRNSIAPLIVVLFVVLGCAGGGTGNTFSLSRATGSFGGGFQTNDHAQAGQLVLNIDSSGAVTGTITNTASGDAGTVTGTVSQTGSYNLNANYNSGGSASLTGSLSFGENDSLNSTFLQSSGSTNVSGTFSLVKGVDNGTGGGGGGSAAFAGNFSGAIAVNGNSSAIQIAISIGSNGDISGSIVNNVTSRMGSFSGHVNSDGSFTLNVNYGSARATWTGTLSADSSGLSGSFQESGAGGTLIGTFSLSRS